MCSSDLLELRNWKAESLVHHSDRGVQYACGDYIGRLRQAGIVPSMSRAGCPWDNAMAESFMATLKREEVDGRAYRDMADARGQISMFLEQIYNCQRLHSALGYRPPEAFEAELPRQHGLPHAPSHAAVVDGVCA